MNLLELRDLMEERSAAAPPPPGERTVAVAGRVRRVHQRRVALVAGVVVALLLAAGVPVLAGRGTHRAPQPAASPTRYRLIDGFPEYAGGARVVGTADAALAAGQVLTVIVPGNSLGFTFTERCEVGSPDVTVMISWRVNGHPVSSGTCNGSVRPGGSMRDDFGAGDGQTAVLTVTVLSAQRWLHGDPQQPEVTTTSSPVPVPEGTIAIAVGARIPWAQYPLPSQPATLHPLDATDLPGNILPADDPTAQVIDSDPADPLAPRTVTLAPGLGTELDMVAQTPGFLTVLVDGVELTTGEWWDYQIPLSSATLPDTVQSGPHTLTFVPAHLTGGWRVVIHSASW